MNLVNLTPHTINILTEGMVRSIPSTGIARCATESALIYQVEGIPVNRTTYGKVEGLPEPSEGTVYIVSALVRMAVPTRNDVVSPGDLVRDEKGQPIGCKNLVGN